MRITRTRSLLIGVAILTIGLSATGLVRYVRRAHIAHPRSGAAIIVPGQDATGTMLFNGWHITPAGRPVETGDMLLGGAISPDGRTLAISNCGFGAHAVHLIDLATEKEIVALPVKRAWNGIAWSPDGGRIYVGGGIQNDVNDLYVFEKSGAAWVQGKGWKLAVTDPAKRCVAGLALSPDGRTLYALNHYDKTLYAIATDSGAARWNVEVGDHPMSCRLSADGKNLYVANMGGSEVAVVDVSNSTRGTVTAHLPTADHPNDLALAKDGRLFVSCGNEDRVSVYDTNKNALLESFKTTPTPRSALGATPNALSLSSDGKTLYTANADNNDICVADVSSKGKTRVRGFIPTGWYPTSVSACPDGKRILVGSGKGVGSRPNPATTPIDRNYTGGFEYIGKQLSGTVSFVDVPNAARLGEYTRQVAMNMPYKDSQIHDSPSEIKSAIPTHVGAPSPIKHVLYIIKENRTYDQVFGDMKQGNGDANLCLFGRDVTPNQHALSDQFVLLDNLYCNGEVSQDGHPWSTSAYGTDFTQRHWTLSYSGHGPTSGGPEVEDPHAGYIWQACQKKGLTYRSYGEYSWHKSFVGHVSEKFNGKPGPGSAPLGRDTDRADIFIGELKEFERTKAIPNFMVMSLGENHTSGALVGAYTPKAMVASNDLAVGKIVEAISHSSAWKEFAIFIIEDDAQNGSDHVDSHRTTGQVISAYSRRGVVDSTMYSTASMLRTMELILGLQPMTQYDASATPMYASFTDKPDLSAFTLLPPRISLLAKNGERAVGAKASALLDWSAYDRADPDKLNHILWANIKGPNVPMPLPVHRLFPAAATNQPKDRD